MLTLLPEEKAEDKDEVATRKADITAQAHAAVEGFMKLKERYQHEPGDYTFLLEVSALQRLHQHLSRLQTELGSLGPLTQEDRKSFQEAYRLRLHEYNPLLAIDGASLSQ